MSGPEQKSIVQGVRHYGMCVFCGVIWKFNLIGQKSSARGKDCFFFIHLSALSTDPGIY